MTHFGQTSVLMFFMITGFLFFSKILHSADGVDWVRLYVSRVMRLSPLYLLAVSFMLAVVYIESDGRLQVSPANLIISVGKWLLYATPDVNNYKNTSSILAGVTWSLSYEWAYYLCLPLIALLAGRTVPLVVLPISAIGLTYAWAMRVGLYCVPVFFAGMVAAYLVKIEFVKSFAETMAANILIVAIADVDPIFDIFADCIWK
jgi:peptidoglycan/LPS O-acetylase OafA/YrhL